MTTIVMDRFEHRGIGCEVIGGELPGIRWRIPGWGVESSRPAYVGPDGYSTGCVVGIVGERCRNWIDATTHASEPYRYVAELLARGAP